MSCGVPLVKESPPTHLWILWRDIAVAKHTALSFSAPAFMAAKSWRNRLRCAVTVSLERMYDFLVNVRWLRLLLIRSLTDYIKYTCTYVDCIVKSKEDTWSVVHVPWRPVPAMSQEHPLQCNPVYENDIHTLAPGPKCWVSKCRPTLGCGSAPKPIKRMGILQHTGTW